jgi:hypothetical protein
VLTAGQRTIVVRSRAAFSVRHPEIPFSSIAGEYINDSLENAGESVRLVSASGAVILDFTYGTTGVWPLEADGAGRSLVLIKPGSSPDLNSALNWRASTANLGTPLGGDATGYAAWKSANSVASDSDDSDDDGILPFGEYASGASPTQPALNRLPAVQRDANGDWIVTITRALSADEADFTLQTSTAPDTWSDAAIVIQNRVVSGDSELFTCKLSNPPGAPRFFLRCRWFQRP